MHVRLVWITPGAEKVIAYCARVSNPANQSNPDIAKLIRYCARNAHWSVFEMANACFEIETSRAISAQIARHRSFSFQEFSQRYAAVVDFEPVEARRQDVKNRQNSVDDLPPETRAWFKERARSHFDQSLEIYEEAIAKGIAKECARMILPVGARSRMYMNGTIRSWIHYLAVRTAPGTQKEHRDIALRIRKLLTREIPLIASAMEWAEEGAGDGPAGPSPHRNTTG